MADIPLILDFPYKSDIYPYITNITQYIDILHNYMDIKLFEELINKYIPIEDNEASIGELLIAKRPYNF